jgi:F-type H+-transporting ATPase subunit a
MPHGQTWFSFLPFHEHLLQLASVFSQPFTTDGLTWYAHEPIDLQHVYGALLVVLLLALVGIVTFTSVKKSAGNLVPQDKLTIRNFAEIFVGVAFNMMADVMGKKAARYFLPLIGTCAFFIFFSNAMGMIPGFIPPTSKFNTTFGCAIVIFLTTHIYGVKEHGLPYFKEFLGPIIAWPALPLMILMLFIELVSQFARPLSLGIRLMANMTADHMVVAAFLALVPFLVPVPMMLLGCLVIVIQTLVFCLLSTVYISMAIKHAEHEHE